MAKRAAEATNQAMQNEQEYLANVTEQVQNYLNGGSSATPPPEVEPIDTATSYVGYYADMDGNGSVDGIIYVDLAKGKTATGSWGDADGEYEIEYEIESVTTGLKEYYVSNASYKGNFYEEEKPVISLVKGSVGKERFYIMALEDVKDEEHGNVFDWYHAAYGKEDETMETFGSGRNNTTMMIAKWDASEYGAQNACSDHLDMWGVIKEKVNEGWYVPSKGEWSAFGNELGITKENYVNYNLNDYYWTSSGLKDYAYHAVFIGGFVYRCDKTSMCCVRLGATF